MAKREFWIGQLRGALYPYALSVFLFKGIGLYL